MAKRKRPEPAPDPQARLVITDVSLPGSTKPEYRAHRRTNDRIVSAPAQYGAPFHWIIAWPEGHATYRNPIVHWRPKDLAVAIAQAE